MGDPRLLRRRRRDHRVAPPAEHRAPHPRHGAAHPLVTRADIAVLQAGAWGTTLATILARDGGKCVTLWTRDAAQAEEIAARRENRRYLPGIRIPDAVEVTADLDRALEALDLLVAVPAAGVRGLRDR
ncbi:MAG: hypothetical protein FJ028_08405, partial [Chloroflexi bacterium]|nr:hypothetical protein [Chloroflexota bacterium]